MTTGVVVRPARTSDVREIRTLVDVYSPDDGTLSTATATVTVDIQDFLVSELYGRGVGCGARHAMSEVRAELHPLPPAPQPAQVLHHLDPLILLDREPPTPLSQGRTAR